MCAAKGGGRQGDISTQQNWNCFELVKPEMKRGAAAAWSTRQAARIRGRERFKITSAASERTQCELRQMEGDGGVVRPSVSQSLSQSGAFLALITKSGKLFSGRKCCSASEVRNFGNLLVSNKSLLILSSTQV